MRERATHDEQTIREAVARVGGGWPRRSIPAHPLDDDLVLGDVADELLEARKRLPELEHRIKSQDEQIRTLQAGLRLAIHAAPDWLEEATARLYELAHTEAIDPRSREEIGEACLSVPCPICLAQPGSDCDPTTLRWHVQRLEVADASSIAVATDEEDQRLREHQQKIATAPPAKVLPSTPWPRRPASKKETPDA